MRLIISERITTRGFNKKNKQKKSYSPSYQNVASPRMSLYWVMPNRVKERKYIYNIFSMRLIISEQITTRGFNKKKINKRRVLVHLTRTSLLRG